MFAKISIQGFPGYKVVFHNFIAGKPDHEDPNHPDHVPSVFMHTTTTRKEREELLRKYLESKYIPSQRMTYTVDYLVNLKSYIGSRDFISKYRREGGGIMFLVLTPSAPTST